MPSSVYSLVLLRTNLVKVVRLRSKIAGRALDTNEYTSLVFFIFFRGEVISLSSDGISNVVGSQAYCL